MFFGLFPLARYSVDDLTTQLKDGGGRGATGGKDRHRLRNGLVVTQVALALVLLVGAGLMFRSVQALRGQDPGFDVDGVLSARLSIPSAEAPGWQETAGFFRQLRERMMGQPGVSTVGFAQPAPLTGGVAFVTIGVEDHPRGPDEMPIFSSQMSVGEGYFETMGIEVLSGRAFQPGDGAEGTRAVLISESFANHWWPDTSPLGRRIGDGGPDGADWWEIVGVVGDVTHQNLQADPEELLYFPITRGPAANPGAVRSMDILVRTSGDPLLLIPTLRRELRDLNPRVPLSNPRTMEEVFRLATAPMAVTMTMLGAASGIALLLGLIGIYGVISYVVSQRTREIGVRMALGATGPVVRGMVVRQGLALAAGGVALGLVTAGLLSSLMSSLLFQVGSLDPLTYASVSVALLVVATFASWLPARRAAGVDPSTRFERGLIPGGWLVNGGQTKLSAQERLQAGRQTQSQAFSQELADQASPGGSHRPGQDPKGGTVLLHQRFLEVRQEKPFVPVRVGIGPLEASGDQVRLRRVLEVESPGEDALHCVGLVVQA